MDHWTIRNEPPSLDLIPKVIYDDEKFLVINKPPYVNVHTGGGYLYNTVEGILKHIMKRNEELYGKNLI